MVSDRTSRSTAEQRGTKLQSIFTKKYFAKQRNESKRERELREITGGEKKKYGSGYLG